MSTNEFKPVIGISCGDINGIGPEVILKTLSDSRMLDICTPVIFGNNKVLNFYRKTLPENNITFNIAKDSSRINTKQVNVYNCWEEDVAVTPGDLNETGGKYALLSLTTAAGALKENMIDGLVTATYADGSDQVLGKVALASFTAQEGLRPVGDSHWQSTGDSGPPAINAATNGALGTIRSGALERANVDITEELVGLISAQRNYQANAKAIETSGTITQTIININ